MTLLELKEEMIKQALERNNNCKTKAAYQLGVSVKTVHNYINKFKSEQSK